MPRTISKLQTNEQLKALLSDRLETYKSINTEDLDDTQLTVYNRYLKLQQFEQDLLYLRSFISVLDIATLYQVSRQYIYKRLKLINEKLYKGL